MKKDDAYYPSAFAANKYFQYFRYLIEFAKYNDWASIKSSFRLVLMGSAEKKQRIAKSRLGNFLIREGTTDFQFINYAYERKIRNYLKTNINSFDVFIDIGACIGEYCVWLAQHNKECYAFEPVPKNYIALEENINLNNVKNKVKTYPYGLGEKEEEVLFEVMDSVTGSSHINRNNNISGEKIKIKELNNILPESEINSEKRIILKMDVEGMEVDVLNGGHKFIERIKNLRVIYEHSFSGADEIKNKLLKLGNFEFKHLDEYNMMATKKSS
ncbi:FkbM family methyltransferase [Marivirga sp.]|uniref:FkbM family methyltransferase n=1 Tax=Marivirga sp. TaxID=2018662 RepID=UPI003DA798B1